MSKRVVSMTGSPQRTSERLKRANGLREAKHVEEKEVRHPRSKTNKLLVHTEKKNNCLKVEVNNRKKYPFRAKIKSKKTTTGKVQEDSLKEKDMGCIGSTQINTIVPNEEEKEESVNSDSIFNVDWSGNKKFLSPLKSEVKSGEYIRRSKQIKTNHDTSNLVSNSEKLVIECSSVINGIPLLENCEDKSIVKEKVDDKVIVLEYQNLEKVAGGASEIRTNDLEVSGTPAINIGVWGMGNTDDAVDNQNVSNRLKLSFEGPSEMGDKNAKDPVLYPDSKLDSEGLTSSQTHVIKSSINSERYLGTEGMSCTLKPDACQEETGDSNNDPNICFGLKLTALGNGKVSESKTSKVGNLNNSPLRETVNSSEKPSKGNSKGKIPGQSFVVAIKGAAMDGKSLFNCVLCFDPPIQVCQTGSVFNKHIRSRQHALRAMEVENYQLYLKYKESNVSDDQVRDAILTYEAMQGRQIFTLAMPSDYQTKREIVEERINFSKEKNSKCSDFCVAESKIGVPDSSKNVNTVSDLSKGIDNASDLVQTLFSNSDSRSCEMVLKEGSLDKNYESSLGEGKSVIFKNCESLKESGTILEKDGKTVLLKDKTTAKSKIPKEHLAPLSNNTEASTSGNMSICNVNKNLLAVNKQEGAPVNIRNTTWKETLQSDKIIENNTQSNHDYSKDKKRLKAIDEEKISHIMHPIEEDSLDYAEEEYPLHFVEEGFPKQKAVLSLECKKILSSEGENVGSSSKPDFEKLVFVVNSSYAKALKSFASDKVKIFTSMNLKLNHVKVIIERKMKEFGPKTLWLFVVGTADMFRTNSHETCTKNYPPCSKSIINLSPSPDIKAIEDVDSFVSKFRMGVINLLQDVRAVIPRESFFLVLPSLPLILSLQSMLPHEKLHSMIDSSILPAYTSPTEFNMKFLKALCTKLNIEILSLAIENIEVKFSSRPLRDYKREIPISQIEIVTGSSDPSANPYNLWQNFIHSLINHFLSSNYSVSEEKNKFEFENISNNSDELNSSKFITLNEIKSEPVSPMVKTSFGNVYDHLVFIGCQKLLDQIPETLNCSMSQWNLQFPIDWHIIDQKFACLNSKAKKRVLFIILGDVSTISMEVYDPQCKVFKCKNLISYFSFGIFSYNTMIVGRIDFVKRLISKIKEKFQNSKVVSVSPRIRYCIERPQVIDSVNHKALHKLISSNFYPCIVEGFKEDWVKAVDSFKKEWNKQLENNLSSETDEIIGIVKKFNTKNASLINWVSLIDIPASNEKLFENKCLFKDLIKFVFPHCSFMKGKLTTTKPRKTRIKSCGSTSSFVLLSSHLKTKGGSPNRLGFAKGVHNNSISDKKFIHIFMIGKEEIISPLHELNLDNNTYVSHFFYSADKNNLVYFLKKINPLPPNSVCFLTFNLTVVLEKDSILPICEKYKCEPPIKIHNLKTIKKEKHLNCSYTEIIIRRIKELIELCNELSKIVPVVIMPLYPSKVFFINNTSHLHDVNHARFNKDLFVVSGVLQKWEQFFDALIKAWSISSKRYHDQWDKLNVLPMYSCSNSSFPVISNIDADSNCVELKCWVNYFKSVLRLLKESKTPYQRSRNVDKNCLAPQVSMGEETYLQKRPTKINALMHKPSMKGEKYTHKAAVNDSSMLQGIQKQEIVHPNTPELFHQPVEKSLRSQNLDEPSFINYSKNLKIPHWREIWYQKKTLCVGDSRVKKLQNLETEHLYKGSCISKSGAKMEDVIKLATKYLEQDNYDILILVTFHCDFTTIKSHPMTPHKKYMTMNSVNIEQLVNRCQVITREWHRKYPDMEICWTSPMIPNFSYYNHQRIGIHSAHLISHQESDINRKMFRIVLDKLHKEWDKMQQPIRLFKLTIIQDLTRNSCNGSFTNGFHPSEDAAKEFWFQLYEFLRCMEKSRIGIGKFFDSHEQPSEIDLEIVPHPALPPKQNSCPEPILPGLSGVKRKRDDEEQSLTCEEKGMKRRSLQAKRKRNFKKRIKRNNKKKALQEIGQK